ncbi:hypothetical protein NQ318_017830 [Aromia moschata]|uniref:Protein PET100 homolog, mitochondrial n=1 Tax=Aromia moschata TaxID=1265417 RepID=A0AAV8YGL4_9CUCU|nr:hypothetical protein NQ318_017830 [Aromia moschata]
MPTNYLKLVKHTMGGWKLEVAKMALYITFPVGLFHYFNQPEYFEEWVVKTKREIYPPESKSARENFEQAMQAIKHKQELSLMASLEDEQNSVR